MKKKGNKLSKRDFVDSGSCALISSNICMFFFQIESIKMYLGKIYLSF